MVTRRRVQPATPAGPRSAEPPPRFDFCQEIGHRGDIDARPTAVHDPGAKHRRQYGNAHECRRTDAAGVTQCHKRTVGQTAPALQIWHDQQDRIAVACELLHLAFEADQITDINAVVPRPSVMTKRHTAR